MDLSGRINLNDLTLRLPFLIRLIRTFEESLLSFTNNLPPTPADVCSESDEL